MAFRKTLLLSLSSRQKSETSDMFKDGGGTPHLHSLEKIRSPELKTGFRLIHLPHLRQIISIRINTSDVRSILVIGVL